MANRRIKNSDGSYTFLNSSETAAAASRDRSENVSAVLTAVYLIFLVWIFFQMLDIIAGSSALAEYFDFMFRKPMLFISGSGLRLAAFAIAFLALFIQTKPWLPVLILRLALFTLYVLPTLLWTFFM